MTLRTFALAMLSCALAAFLAGAFTAKLNLPPVPQMASFVRSWTSDTDSRAITYRAADIEKVISFESAAAATERREALSEAILSNIAMPEVSAGSGLRYARKDLVRSHQSLRFEMRHGIVSNVHLLQPANYNRQIFILHGGHDSWPEDFGADRLITALLEKGFGVALFSMPLTGYNRQKISVATDRFGTIDLVNHNAFRFVEEPDFSPIGYFIDPVLAFVRFAHDQKMADDFAMGGLSGGGWTTVVVAALEPRITKSYVVAGTSPEYLTPHVTPAGWGDYEQTDIHMLRAANYLEMYALGALEAKRKQVHLFARNDPCCWNGPNLGTYENPVRQRLGKVGGGRFDVDVDEDSTEHSYSSFTNDIIIADLMRR